MYLLFKAVWFSAIKRRQRTFSILQGAVATAKQCVVRILCEMQRDLNFCARITRKRETSKNKAIVFGFGATVQQKESSVRAHSGGFLQTLGHSTLHRVATVLENRETREKSGKMKNG